MFGYFDQISGHSMAQLFWYRKLAIKRYTEEIVERQFHPALLIRGFMKKIFWRIWKFGISRFWILVGVIPDDKAAWTKVQFRKGEGICGSGKSDLHGASLRIQRGSGRVTQPYLLSPEQSRPLGFCFLLTLCCFSWSKLTVKILLENYED